MNRNNSLPYTRFVLQNGLTVLLYPMEKVFTAYANLVVKVGGIYEQKNQIGISHFVEHISFLGTKKYEWPLLLSQEAQSMGALYNGHTNYFETGYFVKLPFNNIERGLDFLSELVFYPLLRPVDIEKERSVIVSEYDDFWHNLDRRFDYENWIRRFCKKGHPYARDILGTPKTIKSISKEAMIDWRKKNYFPANMILSIAGNFDTDKIKQIIKKKFYQENIGIKNEGPVLNSNDYSEFTLYHKKDKRPQIKFFISFPSFGWKNEPRQKELTLALLNRIFGRGTSSRLFQRIREKERLVYKIGTDCTTYPYMGIFEIWGSVSEDKLLNTFKIIREEIDLLLKEGISDFELNLAVSAVTAGILMRFDNPDSIANFLAGQEGYNRGIWLPEKYIAEYKKIKKEDVHSLAINIFDFKKTNIGLLGKISEKTKKDIEEIFKK